MEPYRSRDVYRIGKSLRKKGFSPDAALGRLSDLQDEVNTTLRGWVSQRSRVTVTPGAGPIEGRRTWHCEIAGKSAEIPCGGTHVDDVSRIAEIEVELSGDPDGSALSMTTSCSPAGGDGELR